MIKTKTFLKNTIYSYVYRYSLCYLSIPVNYFPASLYFSF